MDDPVADPARRARPPQHHARRSSRSRTRPAERALREHPDRFFAGINVDPNEGMEALRKIDRSPSEYDLKCVQRVPRGPLPAGRDQRQEVLPDLREVRRARHPVLLDRGRARSAHPVRAAGRRAHRRGVLVLPRAEVRHAPRLRAVDRPRGEAAPQVAEPLLLDHRVRAEVLPEGHHRLREHARRRQGDLLAATSPPASPTTASSPSCPTCRSATTCGRSSCARTRKRVFKLP